MGFTSQRFTSPRFTSPRFTSPRFTSPVHMIFAKDYRLLAGHAIKGNLLSQLFTHL